jgi:hypothetical protein
MRRRRLRNLLEPLAVFATPATALLGLTIGMTLGTLMLPPPKRLPEATAPAPRGDALRAAKPAPNGDRRTSLQAGF